MTLHVCMYLMQNGCPPQPHVVVVDPFPHERHTKGGPLPHKIPHHCQTIDKITPCREYLYIYILLELEVSTSASISLNK